MKKILIVGTGLIGASVGLALRASGFDGEIVGTGPRAETLTIAQECGAIDRWVMGGDVDAAAASCDVILLAGPVLSILDWMQRLAPVLGEHQLVTDVGSTKVQIAELGTKLYNQAGGRRDSCRDIRWRGRSLVGQRWRRQGFSKCDVAVYSFCWREEFCT